MKLSSCLIACASALALLFSSSLHAQSEALASPPVAGISPGKLQALEFSQGTRIYRALYGLRLTREMILKAIGESHLSGACNSLDVEFYMEGIQPARRSEILKRFMALFRVLPPVKQVLIVDRLSSWIALENALDVAHRAFSDTSFAFSTFYSIPETRPVFQSFKRIHLIKQNRIMFESTFASAERGIFTDLLLEKLATLPPEKKTSVLADYQRMRATTNLAAK